MPIRLGVNVDHIATLRQARRGTQPDPVEAALVCERAGASSIVCHLREDRRHIQDHDARRLKTSIVTRLNLEMSIAPAIVDIALKIKPDQVTLVPERRQELTTEGGLDVARLRKQLHILIPLLHRQGIAVSLFIDPTLRQLRASRDVGATVVELHTGGYANANGSEKMRALRAIRLAARQGRALSLEVAAGHGLDYKNVHRIVSIPEIEELNIGYSIITHALSVGLERAVREMVALLKRTHAHGIRTT